MIFSIQQDIKPRDFPQTFISCDFLFICSPNQFVWGFKMLTIGGYISLYFRNYIFLKILLMPHLPLEFGVCGPPAYLSKNWDLI